ncbi:MAG: type II toxin-antitoxin system YoeB family toxin [Mariprofundaceae bacterium]
MLVWSDPVILKENLAGFWSRRIDNSNRLVYAVNDTHITVIAYRYHYEKKLTKAWRGTFASRQPCVMKKE